MTERRPASAAGPEDAPSCPRPLPGTPCHPRAPALGLRKWQRSQTRRALEGRQSDRLDFPVFLEQHGLQGERVCDSSVDSGWGREPWGWGRVSPSPALRPEGCCGAGPRKGDVPPRVPHLPGLGAAPPPRVIHQTFPAWP